MPTGSQLYLSTRGGFTSFSFRAAVLKGLAADGGLFIPHSIPPLPPNALEAWKALSFQQLAQQILSLYISPEEIPPQDLKQLIERSYSTFRVEEITPLVDLIPDEKLYLLELFHGPTYAFKDVALQFLGNLFEYFLQKENEGKVGKERDHLTVLGATSGDTGRFEPQLSLLREVYREYKLTR
jgi:threonine synthase